MNVKRFIIGLTTTIFIASAALQADAQKQPPPPPPPPQGPKFEQSAFGVGDNTIGFSLGFGSQNASSEWNQSPAFGFNFDHGLIGNVGPGTIGIGGIVAFQFGNHTLGNGETQNRSDVIIGVRGTYHLTIFKDKRWDPYGGLTLGAQISSKDGDPGNSHNGSESNVDFHFGIYAGCKYNFKPNFGAFAELGPDLSFFRIGIAYNF